MELSTDDLEYMPEVHSMGKHCPLKFGMAMPEGMMRRLALVWGEEPRRHVTFEP